MKKILIITDNLPNQINGVVTTYNNIKNLAEIDGYRVEFLDPTQFKHFDCPGYKEIKLAIPFGIGKKILAHDPDYIHIATEGPVGFAARCWLDRHHWKYNTSYHTKFPEFIESVYEIPAWMTYRYFRWFHKHSGKVLVTTTTMARELEMNRFDGPFVVWTRGVNREIFNPSRRIDNSSEKILLSVGRVSKEKNLDAFCSLQIPNTRKVLVGDGPYLDELRGKYTDIEFVGAKRGIELAEYFASADVFVFTSKTDTFGIVMIESISCGTPIAGYPVPGPIDIVENGVNGYSDNEISVAIEKCLDLDRSVVYNSSKKWTWEECWTIFRDNLISI